VQFDKKLYESCMMDLTNISLSLGCFITPQAF